MMNLKEKVILITGASSGIGRGCAVAFAAEGSFLSLTGRNLEALNEVKTECEGLGVPENKVLIIQADVTVDADCERIVTSTVSHFGQIDVLVNSAGTLARGSLESLTMEEYDQQMRVNTRSPFLITKLALSHILANKGNIVNVSSITGIRAFPGIMAYNMSKSALDHFTQSLSLEVASRGVRVNSVNPGVIVTNVHKRSGVDDEAYEKFLEHSKTTHALGRVGQVKEVADAVVFLASDKASFITGHLLPIDGGRGVMCPR